MPGSSGTPLDLGQFAGGVLEPEGVDVFGRRADEDDALGRQPPGEAGVLGEKAVAGMDGLGAGGLAGGDDGIDVEVALGGGRGSEPHGLVGERTAMVKRSASE